MIQTVYVASIQDCVIEREEVLLPHQLATMRPPDVPFLHENALVLNLKKLSDQPGLIIDEGPEILFKRKYKAKVLNVLNRYVQVSVLAKKSENLWFGQLFGIQVQVERVGCKYQSGIKLGVIIKEVEQDQLKGIWAGQSNTQEWKNLQKQVFKLLKMH